jgi:hypothetical protein
MKNLILGYKRGWNKWECLQKALENCDVVTEDFDKIKGPYDRIYTVAESLLPIQAKLEKEWGLNNVSEKAADILSDKKKMDDFCITIGLQSLIPYSVIPTSPKDLNYWEDKPFIIKPIIGSGAKPGGLNYTYFKNKKEFLDLNDSSLYKSWEDPAFNNRLNHYMVQDKLPDEAELWGSYYYVNESGVLKNLLWVRGKCREGRNVEFMSFDKKDVPKDIVYQSNNFFERLVATLRLKNMFFSGPDFYKWKDNIKMIDCNSRIGQGLQQMDDVHNNTIVPKILQNKTFSYDKQIYWVLSNLKPGKIESVKDVSHLKEYWCQTNNDKLRPGETIPKSLHLTSEKVPRIAFLITGTNESDMLKTYQTVNSKLQDCITYSTQ